MIGHDQEVPLKAKVGVVVDFAIGLKGVEMADGPHQVRAGIPEGEGEARRIRDGVQEKKANGRKGIKARVDPHNMQVGAAKVLKINIAAIEIIDIAMVRKESRVATKIARLKGNDLRIIIRGTDLINEAAQARTRGLVQR